MKQKIALIVCLAAAACSAEVRSGAGGSGGSAGLGGSGGLGGTGGAHEATGAGGSVDPPPPCDVSLADDAANCGAPGHDCLGGACVACVCQPRKLADLPGIAYESSVMDTEYVYVGISDNGGDYVLAISRSDGHENVLVAPSVNVKHLAVHDGFVYWADGRIRPDGTESAQLAPFAVFAIAGGTRYGYSGYIDFEPLSPLMAEDLTTLAVTPFATPYCFVWELFTDGAQIYSSEQGNDTTTCPQDPRTRAYAIADGTPTELVNKYAKFLGVVDGYLYYYDIWGGDVYRVAVSGAESPEPLPEPPCMPALDVDGSSFYCVSDEGLVHLTLDMASEVVQAFPARNSLTLIDDRAFVWAFNYSEDNKLGGELWQLAR